MDNLFTLFFILVFVLGPILEGMRKKEQERQRQQRPPAPPEPVRPAEPVQRSSTEEVSGKPRDAAAAMIPDDLWQILTGETRPPARVPAPQTQPQAQLPPPASKQRPWDVVYIPPEEIGEEEAGSREDVSVEVRRSSREAVAREHAARHKPVEAMSLEVTEAKIVSLETPLPTAAARHTAFHRKLDAKPAAAAAPPARKAALGLVTRTELQRAFVLQEILGKPRGLE